MASTASNTQSNVCILFVGSNPSQASICNVAFHGTTRSSKILTKWCTDVKGLKMHINVSNETTAGNRPLRDHEINKALRSLKETIDGIKPDKIVALGKTAAKALSRLRVEFLEMPHPSGRNRKLNDKEYEAQKIKELVEYCNQTSSERLNDIS